MEKISDIFIVKTGGDLWLEKEVPGNIPVVSLGFENNGIVGYIQKNDEHHLYPAGSITVSGWAGGMKAFVQIKDFYVRGRVKILIPKIEMTMQQKMFYCCCFNANAYRYTYGRKSSGERFSDVMIPSIEEIPSWINKFKIEHVSTINTKNQLDKNMKWEYFSLKELFGKPARGTRIINSDRIKGDIPFITAGGSNEGVTDYISNSEAKTYVNSFTIDMFGNCFYHDYKFKCDDNILVFTNDKINTRIGLFIATIISKNKYKNSYGRQYRQRDYEKTIIKLPIDDNGNPNWNYMDNYIKKIPYGDKI